MLIRFAILVLLSLALVVVACRPQSQAALDEAIAAPSATIKIVYVTPTTAPTRVPTLVRIQPTAIPTATPKTIDQTSSQAGNGNELDCRDRLMRAYTEAGNRCLGGPSGHFCSGGGSPNTAPEENLLRDPGAVIEAARLDALRSLPLDNAAGGGLIWLRLEENILMDALLIGQVSIQNVVLPDSDFAKWQSFTLESGTSEWQCDGAPEIGVMVIQGLYGQTSRVVVNGVSLRINGTVIVLTQDSTTKFIAIEGQARLLAFGQFINMNAGEQLDFSYPPGDWRKPEGAIASPSLFEYDLVKDLPIVLFDRPVPIPQPGYAQTQGGVNMRIAPDIEAQLLFQVPAGETMSVLGISSNREWLHIRLGNGETGWMSAGLLAKNLGEIKQVYDVTPPPPQRYGELGSRAFVNVAAGGNLREAPDTAFRVKGTLPYGAQVKLLARSPYSPWVKVDFGGEVGWMALFTLRSESVIASLPIDYNVPLPPRATATPVFSYGGGHAYPDPSTGY
ncbi:MAG: SH3 domain-containing protein [Chloroflexota bacterium]|nr:SH3 domain-containing protein [Chloroflexota bacterium]